MANQMSLRNKMERSLTYLAYGHEGRNGLDPQTVEMSLHYVGLWKKYFVKYMQDKKYIQNKDFPAIIGLVDGQILGIDGAKLIADNIITGYYNREVAAFLAPTQGQYCEREPGALEFGDLTDLDTSREDVLNRDDNRTHWRKVQVAKSDTPWKRKQMNYATMLGWIAWKKNINRVLINAKIMAKNGAITWNQFNKLCASAMSVRGFKLRANALNG
jgi:hypothetical protein